MIHPPSPPSALGIWLFIVFPNENTAQTPSSWFIRKNFLLYPTFNLNYGLMKTQMHTLQDYSRIWKVMLNLGLKGNSPNINIPLKVLPFISVCPMLVWNVWHVHFHHFPFCIFQCTLMAFKIQKNKTGYVVLLCHNFTAPRRPVLTVAACPSRGQVCLWSLIEVLCSLGLRLAPRGAAADGHRIRASGLRARTVHILLPLRGVFPSQALTWKGVLFVILVVTPWILPTKPQRWETSSILTSQGKSVQETAGPGPAEVRSWRNALEVFKVEVKPQF